MNFILQTINNEVTLDMCFQMQRAKEYWDWRNQDDSFGIFYATLNHIKDKEFFIDYIAYSKYNGEKGLFNPEEWCPIGTVEFVEEYLRTYFGDEVARKSMLPLNVPVCFLNNKMNLGRSVFNISYDSLDVADDSDNTLYYIKDNNRIKNSANGIKTIGQAWRDGLRQMQCSTLIKDGHNASEWRCFIHNGEVVDVKHYMGDPFAFPDMDTVINSYMYQIGDTLREGTLDVYVDPYDQETYVMECHMFFSCGLYGFDHPDILPLMYWRTFLSLIK